jgi:hypothetical protein
MSFDNFSYTAFIPGSETGFIANSAFNFSYNKSNNYNYTYQYGGDNLNSSLLDGYYNDATLGGTLSVTDLQYYYPYTAWMAYEVFAMDSYIEDGQLYYYTFTEANLTNQRGYINYEGGSADYSISYAVKTNNGLKIGLTTNLSTTALTTYQDHEETVVDPDNSNPLNSFYRIDNLEQRGTAFNAKLGIIYDVSDYLKVGGGIHSASVISVKENYTAQMSTFFEDASYSYEDYYTSYKYKLRTPWSYLLNFALIRGKNGLVSLDYKMTDYTSMKFKDDVDPEYFEAENDYMSSQYKLAHQVNLGTEFRFNNLTARLGGGITTPGEPNTNYSIEKWIAAAGLGYRNAKFGIDLAYSYSHTESMIYPYGLSYNQIADSEIAQNRITLSVSFK